MNSVELAVIGGHIDLVRDLVDNFKANIDFSTDVCVHVYIGICIIYTYMCACIHGYMYIHIIILHPLYCTAYTIGSFELSKMTHSFGLQKAGVLQCECGPHPLSYRTHCLDDCYVNLYLFQLGFSVAAE